MSEASDYLLDADEKEECVGDNISVLAVFFFFFYHSPSLRQKSQLRKHIFRGVVLSYIPVTLGES